MAASVLAVLLALGSHFVWFTKLFYDIAPLYNKFRTVSMALVVLQFTLPVLGFLMLDSVVKSGSPARELRKKVLISGGVSLGLLLVLALLQSVLGTFSGGADAGQPDILREALAADRYSLLWSDTLRSLLLVAAAVVLLLWGVSGAASGERAPLAPVRKGQSRSGGTPAETSVIGVTAGQDNSRSGGTPVSGRRLVAAVCIGVLVLADLFLVDKRYLGPDDFVTPKAFSSQFNKRPVDEMILSDPDPSYRVLDLTVNVFNDSHPSYWHKNIGGYSPAKLQRYQEYIDRQLAADIQTLGKAIGGAATVQEAEAVLPYLESLASLNCRYIIVGAENPPLRYPFARGNAWFEHTSGDDIALNSYAPDRLEYSYTSSEGGRAVFSEVYYPAGWVARLEDGTELPIELYEGCKMEVEPGAQPAEGEVINDICRRITQWPVASGLLRCIDLPAGSHTLVMSFEPASYRRGEALSRASSILLLLLVLGAVGLKIFPKKKQ